jgi:hypothetical protein
MTALNVEENSQRWQLVGAILITLSVLSLAQTPTNAHVEHEAGVMKTLHRQSFILIEQTKAHIIIGLFLYGREMRVRQKGRVERSKRRPSLPPFPPYSRHLQQEHLHRQQGPQRLPHHQTAPELGIDLVS